MKQLSDILNNDKILINELMKNHTTFHIGGPVEVMLLPETEEELIKSIKLCKEIDKPFFILGGGSNILVPDEGIKGVVIKLAENYSKVEFMNNQVSAESGVRLSTLSSKILKNNLSGFEFASGIPGTVGGGVYMNAGAYDSEMKNIVTRVRAIDTDGQICEYSNEDMKFGYRTSYAMEQKNVISKVLFTLEPSNYESIKLKIDELTEKRNSKQPLLEYSAGSTFKRPPGNFAGKLIQDAGLKGFSIGEAKVSEMHSGFIINKGNCTYDEMVEFIDEIKRRVYEHSGILLEEEVRIISK